MPNSRCAAFAVCRCVAMLLAAVSVAAAAAGQTMVPAAADLTSASSVESDSGYLDAEQAFHAVFIDSGLAWRAYVENREYATVIYQTPDGRWHATGAVAGDLDSSSIPYHAVPPEAIHLVGAHTHGRPLVPGDSTHLYGTGFSEVDRRAAIHNYQATHGRIAAQLLLTSRLEILQMTLSEGYDAASGRIGVIARVSAVGTAVTSEK